MEKQSPDSVNTRILLVMGHLGYNKNSFSKALGLSNNVTIGNIVGGRKGNPSFDILQKIILSFDCISPKWLITGKGSMLTRQEKSLDVVEEANGQYGKCLSCIKNDAKIDLLTEQLKEQELKNNQLHEKIGMLKNKIENLGDSSNGNCGTKQVAG